MTFERRIGGEMEITAATLRGAAGRGVWPDFAKEHTLRCDTGRSALRLALLDWAQARSSQTVVWVPSYVCSSVGAAIRAAGLAANTYPDRPGLADWPDPPRPAAQDIVVVIHYFGVINRAACAWLDAQASREWGLLEDCVQAPYSAGAGVRGDYAIASLRKWWPAPDGAVVCSRKPVRVPTLSPPDEHYISQRVGAKLLRGNHECEATYLKWIEESEQQLADVEPRQASWVSRRILAALDSPSAAAARRDNWLVLLQGLKTHERVRPLFAALAAGEVPLGFPVRVAGGERDSLRAFLMERHVYCPVHWKLSDPPFAADRELSDQILTLPLDQRYDAGDMQRILGHIREFIAGVP